MIAASPTESSPTSAHLTFVAELPRIDRVLRFAFRRLPRHRRDEAVADGRAAAWHAWAGLARRGRDPLEVGPTGIAANAARYVRRGRRLGTGCRGTDVYEKLAQERHGFRLHSLNSTRGAGAGESGESWRVWSSDGVRCTPADEACFRLDFVAWIGRLPERKRIAAELLAAGHATGEVARQLGVTPGAVSQARAWLCASWRAFQGEDGRPGRRARKAGARA